MSFLASRLVYELYASKGDLKCLWTFIKGCTGAPWPGGHDGLHRGHAGHLGIVIRILTTTGLGEKISFFMVSAASGHLWLLLLLTMMCCIVFGMAVTTVAAYILTVTLVAPA